MPYCNKCEQDLPESRFRKTPNGKNYYKNCNKCRYLITLERRQNDKSYAEKEAEWINRSKEKANQKRKERRASGLFVAETIFTDSKSSDRRWNRDNDLN